MADLPHLLTGLLGALPALMRRDPGHDPDTLLIRALGLADTPATIERIVLAALDFGAPEAARTALDRLGGAAPAALRARLDRMWAVADLPTSTAPLQDPAPGRIALVHYSSLPYLSTGYAIRSLALSRALARTGADVHCITRPGFPWDECPETLNCPAPDPANMVEHVDGIPHHRLPAPTLDSWDQYPNYVMAATDALVACLRKLRPSVVMAASNHVCALPALRAARSLGLPMAYDMRGMWELSRAAREPAFMASPQFCYERALETVVAKRADHVFALAPPMRDAMIRRGVTASRITYLPNGCDLAGAPARGGSAALRARFQIAPDLPVIGYAGSFPAYEGLDDLIDAAAQLSARGQQFRLVLVGNESGTGSHGMPRGQMLMDRAASLGIADRVTLAGRVDPQTVPDFLDMFDVMVIPRRSLPVTETVAPLKPAEAMAAGKALVVSSVQGMAGLVEHGRTGLIFAAGDTGALAEQLDTLLNDPAQRDRLGRAASAEAALRFTWDSVAGQMGTILAACTKQGHAEAPPSQGEMTPEMGFSGHKIC